MRASNTRLLLSSLQWSESSFQHFQDTWLKSQLPSAWFQVSQEPLVVWHALALAQLVALRAFEPSEDRCVGKLQN